MGIIMDFGMRSEKEISDVKEDKSTMDVFEKEDSEYNTNDKREGKITRVCLFEYLIQIWQKCWDNGEF